VTPQVEQFIITFGYIGVLIGLYIEHVFPPAPMQVVIPVAGFLVGRGELNFWGVWVAGTIGGVLGSYTLYELGHWVDEPRVRRFVQKHGRWLTISENDLDRSLRFLDRYGTAMVFISHMIPLSVVRVIVSAFAGVMGMSRWMFLIYCTAGTILWIGGQLYLAVLVGESWDNMIAAIRPHENLAWGTGIILTILLVIWYLWRFRQQRLAEKKALPTEGQLGEL
jgi:membrane protein DedA with SNARE-associated domain